MTHDPPNDRSAREEAETGPLSPRALVPTVPSTRRGPSTAPRVDDTVSAPPAAIAGHRVIRELGRGGMGVVYLAAAKDDRFDRRVAIKVLKRGMDTEDILRRFELERQLLAALNHPGIARLFDAGETEDGLPFYVMEYIDGLPVSAFCDERHLGIDERVDLFRKICDIVHYAHQNLVIHRDLKPSNILVNQEGQPKLLDFGIAKILSPEFASLHADPTAPQLRVMTPEYASPEQVRGLPLTTASDVYSLGVVLYELLSGRRPYRLRSRLPSELERAICTDDPEKPSTALSHAEEAGAPVVVGGPATTSAEAVSRARGGPPQRIRRRLAGDLDNIVFKAMRKEPQRRYTSAEQLSEDLRRHLVGLPVTARPNTLTYRVTKFVRRHRAGMTATSAIVAVTIGATAASAWSWQAAEGARRASEQARQEALRQERIADAERAQAQRRFDQVRSLANTFILEFHDSIRKLDGALPARQMLVEQALVYLDGLAADADGDPDLTADLARGYLRVGDLRGGVRTESLGDTPGALASYRRALDLRTALATAAPDVAVWQRDVSTAQLKIGELLLVAGDVNEALALGESALAIRARLHDTDPMGTGNRRDLAVALGHVGAALLTHGRTDEASRHYERSLALREALATEHPLDPANADSLERHRDLASMYQRTGGRFAAVGDWASARTIDERALAIRERVAAASPGGGRYERDLAMTSLLLADIVLEQGDPLAAEPHYRRCLEIVGRRREANPRSSRARLDLALAHEGLGRLLATQGRWDEALPEFRAMQETIDPLAQRDPPRATYRLVLAVSHQRVAWGQSAAGDHAAALETIRPGLLIMDQLVEGDAANDRFPPIRARMQTQRAAWLRVLGRADEARAALDAARAVYVEALEQQPRDPDLRGGLAEVLHERSRLAADAGDGKAALALATAAVDAAPVPSAALLRDLAWAQHLAGDDAAAAETALRATRRLAEEPAPDETLRRTLGRDLRVYRMSERGPEPGEDGPP